MSPAGRTSGPGGTQIASLRRRYAAGMIDVVTVIAALVPIGIAGGWLYEKMRGDRVSCETGSCRAGEPSKTHQRAVAAMCVVGSVIARNWRGPGGRVIGIRRVDARTGGPVRIRSVVVHCAAGWVSGKATNLPFAPMQRRWLERLQAVQAESREIQRRHAGDPEALQRELMALYQRSGINPLGCALGCFRWQIPRMLLLPASSAFSPRRQNVLERIAGTVVVVD